MLFHHIQIIQHERIIFIVFIHTHLMMVKRNKIAPVLN
jgi:hypothetical protein